MSWNVSRQMKTKTMIPFVSKNALFEIILIVQ